MHSKHSPQTSLLLLSLTSSIFCLKVVLGQLRHIPQEVSHEVRQIAPSLGSHFPAIVSVSSQADLREYAFFSSQFVLLR